MVETETKIQRYESYKDSGVEWLGDIPEHWELILVKRFSKTLAGGTPSTDKLEYWGGDIPWLPSGKLQNCDIEKAEKFISKLGLKKSATKLIRPNTTLIALTGATCANIGYLKFKATANQSVVAIENDESISSSRYVFYALINERQRILLNQTGGAQAGINESDVKNIEIVFPPLPEQTAIAQFLDDKTTKIDQAIAIKQQQIALLKERKQILINKAVTKGVTSSAVEMKDSGVEWIGEIPEHWEVKPLRHIGKTQNGLSKGGEYFGRGFPFLTYSDVYNNRELPYNLSGLAETSYEERKQFSVKSGDVFFTRTSETVGDIGFSSTCFESIENGTFAGFLIRFRPNKNVLDTRFSKFYFSSSTHRPFFVGKMNLVIRASLSQDHLKQMPVLLPPLSEQKEIAQYIETASAKIETAISLKEKEISKLQEYKSSLINSVVTGKVRVC